MRASGTHIVVHTRVHPETNEYIGRKAFPENVRADTKDLRNSYQNPLPARVSLYPTTETDIPVGHIFSDGASRWYIVDQETQELVYIKLDAFFRAGEGDKAHLKFWNPLTSGSAELHSLGTSARSHHRPVHSPLTLRPPFPI